MTVGVRISLPVLAKASASSLKWSPECALTLINLTFKDNFLIIWCIADHQILLLILLKRLGEIECKFFDL